MLSQQLLLQTIDEDMRACRKAEQVPGDEQGRQQRIFEFTTLTRHLEWTRSAGEDQAELERIVTSLERVNSPVRGYQHWRERATVK